MADESVPPASKTCRECGETKPREAFPPEPRMQDGYRNQCRDCRKAQSRLTRAKRRDIINARQRARYAASPEKHREQERQRYLLNKEKVLTSRRIYRANNKEKISAANKKWRIENKEYVQTKMKEWYEANQEHVQSYTRQRYIEKKEQIDQQKKAYRAANREKVLNWMRQWVAKNRAKVRARNAKRRALKMGAPRNDLTPQEWQDIQAAYAHRCVYCGRKTRLTQDHITPLSKGGSHTKSNVVPACRPCNTRKKDRAPLIPVQPLLL